MSIPKQLKRHRNLRDWMIVISGMLLFVGLYDRMIWIAFGLALINLYTIILMGYDKHLSKKSHGFRVPENSFYLLGVVFASLGVLLGMLLFRHKTQHRSFQLIPLLIPIQAYILYWLITNF